MKKEKMLRAMDLVDEKYVMEADPRAIKKKNRRIRAGVIAACACFLLVVVNLWLFLPFHVSPPDVSAYADSEYYEIIQKLNEVTYRKPADKNNYEKYFEDLFSPKVDFETNESDVLTDGMLDAAMPEAAPGASQSYEEVTDNQVKGVTEADRIKRSDKYAYYLDEAVLRVYSIAGMESQEVGAFVLSKAYYDVYPDGWEFYLSKDCKTVTIVAEYYAENYVKLISVDVSDPANMKIQQTVTVSGRYVSSRVVNGNILLLTNFYVGMNPDFSDEGCYLPQIDVGNGAVSLPVENIITPEEMSSSYYTVVTQWEEATLEMEGNTAFLSYSNTVYASQNTVYVSRTYNKDNESYTEISGLSYGEEGMTYKGTVTVEGYLKDQYSMDEYENVLRVVTTTNGNEKGTSASLYCVDLINWKTVAEVKNFAPYGETVRSVRFDGDSAYVCTAVQVTDPVFFFDLSDLNNITYKDTGTITGFSTSLVNFGNGHLLGIGIGDWNTVKIEVYKESDSGVVSVSSYSYTNAYYAETYKAYYIDREQQLVGLGIHYYNNVELEKTRYVLLNFDGTVLQEVINVPLEGVDIFKRAFLEGDYFYMFGDDDFKVVKIF